MEKRLLQSTLFSTHLYNLNIEKELSGKVSSKSDIMLEISGKCNDDENIDSVKHNCVNQNFILQEEMKTPGSRRKASQSPKRKASQSPYARTRARNRRGYMARSFSSGWLRVKTH